MSISGSPLKVSHNTIGDASLPRITVSGNNVYVIWDDNSTRTYEIFLANSTEGGATFGKPINISHNAGDSFDPVVAVSSNSVYSAWDDNTAGNYDILF